jgi:hypothetical protein
MNSLLNKLKLRGKLLALVLPLVIIPIFVVAGVIGLIANQPPTVNSGDTITVVTPAGSPNETRVVE